METITETEPRAPTRRNVTSTSMRFVMTALLASALGTGAAFAAPLSPSPESPDPRHPTVDARGRYAAAAQPGLGGGFIERRCGGRSMPAPAPYAPRYSPARGEPPEWAEARRAEADPRYRRQLVAYQGGEEGGATTNANPPRLVFFVR